MPVESTHEETKIAMEAFDRGFESGVAVGRNLPSSRFAVTTMQVYLMDNPMGKTKATARVMLNEQLQLTGLRVVEGSYGLFIAYPNDPSYKGEDYRSLFYPVTRELREHIEQAVLAKYHELERARCQDTSQQ